MHGFFGRKNELAKLARIFSQSKTGHPRTVLVSGPAGTGKTALVSRFAVEAEKENALFGYGKADPFFESTPFSTVIAALGMVVKKAVADNPDADKPMKQAIRQGLAPVPDRILAALLGRIPALSFFLTDARKSRDQPDLQDNQSFNLGLLLLLETFTATLKRPAVLFLDDLQWMDSASHGFLRYLAVHTRLPDVMLVMAFRPQNGNGRPNLARTLGLYKSLGTTVDLPLSGLTKRETRGWLRQRLATDNSVAPLADICHSKTGGNPFDFGQMLDDLLEGNTVTHTNGEWVYDISYISGLSVTENVADRIIRRINLLTPDCLSLISQAACVHGDIPVPLLVATSGYTREKIETLLWNPVQHDLLRKTDTGYAFAHDKILETAQAMLSEAEAREVHRRIVAYYLEKENRNDQDADIFTLLYHYGFYSRTVSDHTIQREMAERYFAAGTKARDQSAHDQAQAFFLKGKDHYPGDIWADNYDLALAFCRRIAQCAYWAGDTITAGRILDEVDVHARSVRDRRQTELLKVFYFHALQEHDKAIHTGLTLLRHLGIRMAVRPSKPAILLSFLKTWIRFILCNKRRLRKRRMPVDSDAYMASQCLPAVGPVAYIRSPDRLLPVISSVAMNLSLKHGYMEETPVSYIVFGMILNEITGGVRWGRRLGKLAWEISADFNDGRHKTTEVTTYDLFLGHWDKPLKESTRSFQKNQDFCLLHGDHEYYGYNALYEIHSRIIGSAPLGEVRTTIDAKTEVFERINNSFALEAAALMKQVVTHLETGTPQPWVIDHDDLDALTTDTRNAGIMIDYYFYSFCAAFYCGRMDIADTIREKLADHIALEAGTITYFYFHFLEALLDMALGCKPRRVRFHLKRLKKYAGHNPPVYRCRYLLALGDAMRLRGDAEAAAVYLKAGEAARENGFLFEQALAHERLGETGKTAGKDANAQAHVEKAVALYRQWGLKWKHDLFALDPDVGELLSAGPANRTPVTAPTQRPLEAALQSLKTICAAQIVHAAVRVAHSWKSCAYLDPGGMHHPATFVPLPEKMLHFACATDAVVRAGANSVDEQFFDIAYFWKNRPATLMVVPVGVDRGIYIENFETIPDDKELKRLAKQIFDRLTIPTMETPLAPAGNGSDMAVHKENCVKLQEAMTSSTLYADQKLSLARFAKNVGMSQRAVTDAIGICLGQNFRTFVNSYRIEAIKQALSDPAQAHLSILEIAFSLGFNSKSTFNSVFKQVVGVTPSEFRDPLIQ